MPSPAPSMWKRLLVLLPVGAVVGTLGDQIHVQFNVLAYPHPNPFLFGQATWVPFLFAGAGLVLVNSHAILGAPREPQPPRQLIVPFLLFIAAYFSTGIFKATPYALALGLLLAFVLRVALSPSADKIYAGLAYAVGGSAFEGLLSSTGAFHYHHTDLFLVPVWLPCLYMHVALCTRQIYLGYFVVPAGKPAAAPLAPSTV